MNTRLFQAIDSDGENIGLYEVKDSIISDMHVSNLIRDEWSDEEYLSTFEIYRVYVIEVTI